MNNNTNIELLKQYQAGTISEADRHILERAALDDPFLFDAMEGYGVYGSTADTVAIKELKESKANTPGTVRWLTMRKLSVAASLVALLAITFLMKNQLTQSSSSTTSETLASHDTVVENAPIAQTWSEELGNVVNGNAAKAEGSTESIEEEMELDVEDEDKEDDFVAVKIGDVNATATTNVTKEEIQDVKSPTPPQAECNYLDAEQSVLEVPKEKEEIVLTDAIQEESIEIEEEFETTSKSKGTSVRKKSSSKPEGDAISYDDTDGKGEYILGKVLDTDGNHLIGVNVYIENTEIGDVTDLEGNFKLPKYGSGHQMVANYTGYEQQKVIIGDLDFYQIVMPISDNQLSEIRVTRPQEVNENKAFPAMGMEDFEVYVSENKKYPLEVFGTTKSGTFEVSFNVNIDGTLSNFVDQSGNCDECFKEAVKLLKGSGKWETKPAGQLYRTRYLFEF